MTLPALLDEGARFNAEYGAGLSNHLPMALVALRRLGAGDARLAAFAARYAQKLAPAPSAQVWPAGDAWAGRLGERAAWPAYRSLFAEWLLHEGGESVLTQVLPALMPGCGAAAFHGLIRVAYAVQAGHEGELADALAYWACRWLPLGQAPTRPQREADPRVLLGALQAALPGWKSDKGLIFERMHEAAALPAFGPVVAQLKVHAGTLRALAHCAAGVYARSGNFTALHLVTSAHALRVLLPFFDDADAAVGDYWRAFAAGFIASGAQPGPVRPALPWAVLAAAAVASDDDHLIKLVDSCREEQRCYGSDDWRIAATRAVLQSRG
ncbi:MAG TPA: questin oxidase family protein [Rubrivivax sp.]